MPHRLTKTSFKKGIACNHRANDPRICPFCHEIISWKGRKCEKCGSSAIADFACARCKKVLVDCEAKYTTKGKRGAQLSNTILSYKCSKCRRIFVDLAYIKAFDRFVDSMPAGIHLLPEMGFQCKQFLEVLATSPSSNMGAHATVKRRSRNIEVRFGPQSRLFERSLDYISAYDLADFGFDISPTIRIKPGPPYSLFQRKTIHFLLSRIQLALEEPLFFWSVHFEAIMETEEDNTGDNLLTLIQGWPQDYDGRALALANAVYNDEPPGRFINVFRLLELVLKRLIDEDIRNSRWQKTVKDKAFLSLINDYRVDLKTKLLRRLRKLPVYPEDALRKIWRIVQPRKAFNREEVCAEIAKFRNYHLHSPYEDKNNLQLPWEIPPFDYLSIHILKLIIAMLSPAPPP